MTTLCAGVAGAVGGRPSVRTGKYARNSMAATSFLDLKEPLDAKAGVEIEIHLRPSMYIVGREACGDMCILACVDGVRRSQCTRVCTYVHM